MKEGWEIKKLGDAATIYNGNSINAKVKESKYKNQKEGIPYIATKDIGFNSIIDYDNGVLIPLIEKEKFKIAPKNSVLICAEGGSAGRKIGYTSKDVCFGNKLFVTIPKDELKSKFVYYYFYSNQFREYFFEKLAGVIGGVSMKKFKEIPIPVPNVETQNRIIEKLDKSFGAINRAKVIAEQNLENAKELFESYLWFFMADKRWDKVLLNEICTKVEYGSSAKSKPTGKVPVLRMGNIQNGLFDWSNLVYTSNVEEIEKYYLQYNDVLFNRTNSPELVGKTAIYKGEQPAIFAGYLIRIHRKEEVINADFLNYYLNSPVAFAYGKTVMSASINQANINGTKLKGYPVPLPPIEEQVKIVSKLDTLKHETQQLKITYQEKLDDLEELKKSILQKAFNGEII